MTCQVQGISDWVIPEKIPAGPVRKVEDNLAIGYLRAFVILLVLLHHSVLAYVQMAPLPAKSLLIEPRFWKAFPVVDSHKSAFFGLLVGFNDIFFMSLMFLLSGLFVWNSLQRKGPARFLNDRALRLGIPFVIAAAILAPVAYYPAYLQTGSGSGISGFIHQWLSLGQWPAGPPWFVWVLLVFDCVVAFLFSKSPSWSIILGKLSCGSSQYPARFFWMLLSFSAAVYIPLSLRFGPMNWTEFGPFAFQTSRFLHYFVYFLAGMSLGIFGIDKGLLSSQGKLARHWLRWSLVALVSFGLAVSVFLATIANLNSRPSVAVNSLLFTISCTASCFAFLAIFVRFARRRRRVYDALRNNSYGMYLVHYAFVSWLQYALLPASWPGAVKGLLVFVGSALLSWGSVSLLRRSRCTAQVL
jgi:hypothetical protein